MLENFNHISVLLEETISGILPSERLIQNLKASGVTEINIVDATIGGAGHASRLVQKFHEEKLYEGFTLNLIGIDQDTLAIETSRKRLDLLKEKYPRFNYQLIHSNFEELRISEKLHGLYADFGVSSPQIDTDERGFSFLHAGPLDMRMNIENSLTAEKILQTYSEEELTAIFFEYGEEPKSRIMARAIIHDRKLSKLPIQDTVTFAEYVKKILKYGYSRTHPATRVFQALRIEVNGELTAIQTLLNVVSKFMHENAKAGFISFHSLEDRLVKKSMRLWQEQGLGKETPRGGITPSENELKQNTRARSARLRIFDFTGKI